MPIFEKNQQCVFFVHIPKTGGTSIESWLAPHTNMSFFTTDPSEVSDVYPQHFTYQDMVEKLGDDFCDWSFAIVRDPYKRLESEFHYRNMLNTPHMDFSSYSAWVIQSLEDARETPTHFDNHFRPQSDFISEEVDVFKLEDGLDTISNKLAEFFALDVARSIDRVNVSKKKPVEYDDDALYLINDFYKTDFERHNYDMRPCQGVYSRQHFKEKARQNRVERAPLPRKLRLKLRHGLKKLLGRA